MKYISTALLTAALASLAACGGGAGNNAAAANNSSEAPPVGNVGDLNTPAPVDNTVSTNASGNATATNSVGNGL